MHRRYAWYVLRHKWLVFVECCRLGIPIAGIVHDLSKLLPREWLPYARYFYGKYTYGLKLPPSVAEQHDFDVAWSHHQHANPHHWQHWVLHEDSGAVKTLMMPERYAREMLADWRGAGRAVGKPDTAAWYRKNAEHIMLHPITRAWIEAHL